MTVEGNEDTTTLAMVSDFTRPDPAVLGKTHGVLMACQYQGARSRRVINAKEIGSVVGMLSSTTSSRRRNTSECPGSIQKQILRRAEAWV